MGTEPLMYQDEHGGLLPTIPNPGDQIRILFRIAPDEQRWQHCYYLGENTAGIWWTPADDRDGAIWSPWTDIAEIGDAP